MTTDFQEIITDVHVISTMDKYNPGDLKANSNGEVKLITTTQTLGVYWFAANNAFTSKQVVVYIDKRNVSSDDDLFSALVKNAGFSDAKEFFDFFSESIELSIAHFTGLIYIYNNDAIHMDDFLIFRTVQDDFQGAVKFQTPIFINSEEISTIKTFKNPDITDVPVELGQFKVNDGYNQDRGWISLYNTKNELIFAEAIETKNPSPETFINWHTLRKNLVNKILNKAVVKPNF